MTTQKRKDEHIQINLNKPVSSNLRSGFEVIRFEHQALPEIDAQEIDTSVRILGAKLKLPLLISSMTGGTPEGPGASTKGSPVRPKPGASAWRSDPVAFYWSTQKPFPLLICATMPPTSRFFGPTSARFN